MKPEEAARIAADIEPDDPEQRAITEAALREVGEGVVTLRRVEGGDPPWQAFRNGSPISFAGLFIYGGETREEAEEAARRIASKWDWPCDFGEDT
jgi:hypothetical protein